MTPRATYRLQFGAGFRFEDAARLAPSLAALGISHVYASPIFAARPGSTHGYDIFDHTRLNPELGDLADFRAMADVFRAQGLGLVLDFVPNHMGIGGASNEFWLDVLAWGQQSQYAAWFDIDWQSPLPGLAGKVMVPFLGDQYGAVLAAGQLDLRFDPDAGSFAVWAHDTHKLPICPMHYGRILARAPGAAPHLRRFEQTTAGAPPADPAWAEARSALAEAAADAETREAIESAVAAFRGRKGDLGSWARLDALISDQHWRATKYNLDCDAINYRRFFTISDLAGIRVEDPAVFDATHRLLLDLLEADLIDGIRIDHIDGLRDPKGYCLRLRAEAARPFWLLVEKIVAPDEMLPADWDADGTTGYEVANLLVGLLTDPAGTEALTETYIAFTGRAAPPGEVVNKAKVEIMSGPMAGETEALASRLYALAARDPMTCDIGPIGLRRALVEVIAALPVYRTYADEDGLDATGKARITAAVAAARRRASGLDPLLFDFLERALTLQAPADPDLLEAVQRAQQLTGPVMAKGLEDAALYRYNRLIALNEVGSEPGRFHVGIADFHAANLTRLEREPLAMLTTSTHDTKRGEDARMRIAAIAGRAGAWREAVAYWATSLGDELQAVDRNDAYFFFQLLLGSWPAEWPPGQEPAREALAAFADRVGAAMLKSVREADEHSRWVSGNPAYEAAIAAMVRRALDPSPDNAFLQHFRAFQGEIAADGQRLGLVQTGLKLTIPGVPDIYQGAELWEQSMVDPDNRRPVDFDACAAMLGRQRDDGRPVSERTWPDGAVKLALTSTLLDLRRRMPALFEEGSYEPLAISGAGAGDVAGFARRLGGEALMVLAALRPTRPPGPDTTLPPGTLAGEWQGVLDGRAYRDPDLHSLFSSLPIAVLRAWNNSEAG